mmetsp:Transcript_34144/g.74965  ORF Transcript_34144/g.74965 Transcript_34144/m.74965 type:complete len:414 (+) Transcript_34144:199-1440(+)
MPKPPPQLKGGPGARASFFSRVLRELLLGNRVGEGAGDSKRAANGAERRELVAEDEHRGEDDADALDRVGDRVRDRRHLVERDKGDLVVRVVVKAVQDHLAHEPEGRHLGGRLGPRRQKGRALVVECERERHAEGHDGEDAVEVGRAHVLADGLVHGGLGEDGARGEGDVGGDGAVEGLPGEGELLERCERDAGDDWQQRGVDGPLEDGAEDEEGEDAREDGLGRLDRLRERDRASAKRDDGAGVAEGVGGADGEEGLERALVELGRLADARRPHEEHPWDADEEGDDGHRPRHREGVLAALVGDVVHDVQREPGGEERGQLHLVHERLRRLDAAGGPRGNDALLDALAVLDANRVGGRLGHGCLSLLCLGHTKCRMPAGSTATVCKERRGAAARHGQRRPELSCRKRSRPNR